MAVMAVAAMLLVAPSGAWAGSAHHGDRHRGRHADTCLHQGPSHHAPPGHRGHAYGHAKHQRHALYFCRPCNRYFDARRGLHDHVAYRHHVPLWQLANVITFNALGWIFYG